MPSICGYVCLLRLLYLIRVVQQRTVITLVTHAIHICVLLVIVVHIGAVIMLIQHL